MTPNTQDNRTAEADELDDEILPDVNDEFEELEDDEDLEDEEDEVEEAPRPRPTSNLDSEEKARLMANIADSVRASDIVALDLRGLTIIADFFLICTGKSSIQLRAVADRIEDRFREIGLRKLRVEGYQEATWILLDYGDVVAHIMAEEQRAFYQIEEFWAEAPLLDLGLIPEPTTLAGSSVPA